ncbi:hypothetical protein [uncultured Rikenella sp.]|uniref:hypothetical protein n=1 Tax=uncultured Rikenella sp. TaxID=368003 RepID=UPI002611D687|nr:hypothetical protein [uncultured Rikenella sp.]
MKMSVLYKAGKAWSTYVWIGKDCAMRDQIINDLNTALQGTSIIVGHGWQPHDPVVRMGRPRNYDSIAADLDSDSIHNAASFIAFANEQCDLEDLPRPLQELCVIVFFAEVGRGYSSSLKAQLYPLVEDIQAGEDNWSSIRTRYAPSLTFKEDTATDYRPE